MRPEIKHLGHACIQYKYGGVVLTTDPWFYGAILKSWYPFPDNRGNLNTALDSDYIYISHAHEDHFDREFLRQVDPGRTTLVIPRFRSGYLEQEIRKLGFDGEFAPVVLGHGDSTVLPTGIKLTMLIDRSHKEDSALLVESPDGFRFLNSNDCELAISDWPAEIDLLACQFSGAFWYPHCYDFDAETMARKIQEVRKNNFDRLCRRVERTQAKAYLPSAGPSCFLPPELEQFNKPGGIFPLWHEVRDEFRFRCPDVHVWPFLTDYPPVPEYRERRRGEWSAWYGESDETVTVEELNAHFLDLQRRNKRFLKDYKNDIYLAADGRHWQVKLGLLTSELEETFDPHYFMEMPMRVLRAVVDGRATWEDALTSMRVKLRREPDVYDLKLMGLLNFGARPVQTLTMAKQAASDEMTTKEGFEFQRWCPHAGEDMNFARVEDGKITCARHEWCWDANTGECLTGQGIPLKVRKND